MESTNNYPTITYKKVKSLELRISSKKNVIDNLRKLLVLERKKNLDLKFELDLKNGELKLNGLPPVEGFAKLVKHAYFQTYNIEVPDDYYKIKTRKREIVVCRQMFMLFLNLRYKMSLSFIGAKCGCRHHSTVIHGKQSIEDQMTGDKLMVAFYEAVNTLLSGINDGVKKD